MSRNTWRVQRATTTGWQDACEPTHRFADAVRVLSTLTGVTRLVRNGRALAATDDPALF